MEGRLGPGEPLRELELAKTLHISQATVREALMRLEPTGLVVRVPNKETTVTRLSQQDLQERKWMRMILEPEVGVEAVSRIGSSELEELERRLDAIDKAVSRNAYFEVAQADLAFHRFIWKAANETAYRVLDNLAAPMFAFVTILRSSTKEDLKAHVNNHQPIFDALKSRDPGGIRECIRQHIENSYDEFLSTDWEYYHALAPRRTGRPV